jgi:hypothetical protein
MPYEPSKPEQTTRKPVSEKQLAANRANALKSTGPTSPEGLARSSQNSRKHGFTAARFIVINTEEKGHLKNLKADLIDTYQPVNSQELAAIERIALAQLSIYRTYQMEAGMITRSLNQALSNYSTQLDIGLGGTHPDDEQRQAFFLAEGLHHLSDQPNEFSLMLRYQAQAERMYRRAIEEFDRLKSLRDELPNEPISSTGDENEDDEDSDPETDPDETELPNEPIPSREAASDPRSLTPDPQSPFPTRPPIPDPRSPVPSPQSPPIICMQFAS